MSETIPNRFRRFERLLDVGKKLNESLELQPMLQIVVNASCELSMSEASSIFLYEEETGLLKFVAAPPSQWEALKRMRIPVENSVAGQCYTQSKPILIPDAGNDPRIFRGVDANLDSVTRSLVAVPLVYRGTTIGVLEAINKIGDLSYTDDDVSILETLAGQAAIAIHTTHLRQEVRRAYNEMAELERMKSNFVAITSHELRTPLGLVLGHATMLAEKIQEPRQKKQLGVIIQSANRLKNIIDDLVSVDFTETGQSGFKRQRSDLLELIREIVNEYQEQAGSKAVAVITDLPDSPLWVNIDGEKIAIALSNLIRNAITFSRKNGHVMVIAESLPGYAKVSVVDDGIGIPAKDLSRIFERFFQVETHMTRHHGGMGLGLSVAKVMVEMHGGQIWVESIEGKGSNFSFLLPSSTSAAQAAQSVFGGGVANANPQ
jgi:signal transduction histidine kinase